MTRNENYDGFRYVSDMALGVEMSKSSSSVKLKFSSLLLNLRNHGINKEKELA